MTHLQAMFKIMNKDNFKRKNSFRNAKWVEYQPKLVHQMWLNKEKSI